MLLRRTYKIQSYTDDHNVDDALRTTSIQGGRWLAGNSAGVTMRYMLHDPTTPDINVASRLIYLS